MNWHYSIFIITFKVLLSLSTDMKACRTIMYLKLITYITDKNIQFYIKATVRVSFQLTKWQCWGNLQVWFNCRDCSSFREKDETRSFICLQGQDVANLMSKTPASWKLPHWKMITIPASVLKPTTTNKNKGNKWENPTPTRGIQSLYIEFPVSHLFKTLSVTQWMDTYLR